MKCINVGIAENTDYNIKQLKDCIDNTTDMKTVFAVQDGKEVASLCQKNKVDVLIVDIALPYNDGFAVLEELNTMKMEKYPVVVVTTAVGTDVVFKKALGLGAQYVIMKPFTPELVVKRVQELLSFDFIKPVESELRLKNYMDFAILTRRKELEKVITKALTETGISSRYKGYNYLKSAICEVIIKPDLINAVTKELYPSIAKKYNTSSHCVEKSIRDAICSAWENNDCETRAKYFSYQVKGSVPRPTNTEFIAVMYEILKDW